LRRLQSRDRGGCGPGALIDPLNRAQERVTAARLERDQAPSPHSLGRAEVEAMLDYLGDVGAALKRATPEKLAELYAALSLELTHHPDGPVVDVAIEPRRGGERVRGELCTNHTAHAEVTPVSRTPCDAPGSAESGFWTLGHDDLASVLEL
jgi:hypothetical protein